MSNSISNIRKSDSIKGSNDNDISATNKVRSRNPIDADYGDLDEA